jgi:diguanylate cyclase (GGDEF)-like protein
MRNSRDASLRRLPLLALVVALSLLVGTGALAQYSAQRENEAGIWVEHTYQVIEGLQRVRAALSSAENDVQAFAAGHSATLLREFEPALDEAIQALRQVRRLTRDNPAQQRRLDRLEPMVAQRVLAVRQLREALLNGSSQPLSADQWESSSEIRAVIAEMAREEEVLLEARQRENTFRNQFALASSWIILAVAAGLVIAAALLLMSEAKRRSHAEQSIVTRHAAQASLLRLSEMLQGCRSTEESYEVIARLAPDLFASEAGAVYLFHPSRNLLEACVTWGDESLVTRVLAPDECWALRRGQAYLARSSQKDILCKHLATPVPASSLCLPMLAHGEVIGMLFLAALRDAESSSLDQAEVIADQLAMALANMQLRERLRDQSIRDPLTGLFNRRYTEETLERELYRAVREKTHLCVLAIDVDHFKKFNDSFGHDAGDYVLKEIAATLKTNTRKSDVVSRTGGEELLVILPHSDLESSAAKAEQLRDCIAHLALSHRGAALGAVTISIGVAVAPEHGITTEGLLRAADLALYRAKHAGRNRIAIADAA